MPYPIRTNPSNAHKIINNTLLYAIATPIPEKKATTQRANNNIGKLIDFNLLTSSLLFHSSIHDLGTIQK